LALWPVGFAESVGTSALDAGGWLRREGSDPTLAGVSTRWSGPGRSPTKEALPRLVADTEGIRVSEPVLRGERSDWARSCDGVL